MSNEIKSFRDMKIWQLGMRIVEETYQLSQKLPESEKFALSSQMRRSAISLPANIAEGFRRRSNKEYKQFLHIALGSSAELETFIDLCKQLYGINGPVSSDLLKQLDQFQSMTVTLIKRLT